MGRAASLSFLPLLYACAAPAPHVHFGAAGLPGSEVSRLVAASEAKLFPCSIAAVYGDNAVAIQGRHPEVTVQPGRYQVTLECTSGYHTSKPQVAVIARPGRAYKVTGYLIDDSITVFNMRMRAKVEPISPP